MYYCGRREKKTEILPCGGFFFSTPETRNDQGPAQEPEPKSAFQRPYSTPPKTRAARVCVNRRSGRGKSTAPARAGFLDRKPAHACARAACHHRARVAARARVILDHRCDMNMSDALSFETFFVARFALAMRLSRRRARYLRNSRWSRRAAISRSGDWSDELTSSLTREFAMITYDRSPRGGDRYRPSERPRREALGTEVILSSRNGAVL